MSCEGLIDFIFAHERDIKAAVREKRLDPGGITGGNGTGHSKISDPTAAQGIRLALPIAVVVVEYGAAIGGVRSSKSIRRPEKWLQVIAETKEFYKGKKHPEISFVSPIHGIRCGYDDVTISEGLAYCLELMSRCDEIILCGNWTESTGCTAEAALARQLGKTISYQDEYL